MTLVNIINKQKKKIKRERNWQWEEESNKNTEGKSSKEYRTVKMTTTGKKRKWRTGVSRSEAYSLTMPAQARNPRWSWDNRVVGNDGVEKRAHSDIYLLCALWNQFQCLNILTVGNNGRVSRNSKIHYFEIQRNHQRVQSCQVWSWQGSVVWTRREFLIPSDTVFIRKLCLCNRCHCMIG